MAGSFGAVVGADEGLHPDIATSIPKYGADKASDIDIPLKCRGPQAEVVICRTPVLKTDWRDP